MLLQKLPIVKVRVSGMFCSGHSSSVWMFELKTHTKIWDYYKAMILYIWILGSDHPKSQLLLSQITNSPFYFIPNMKNFSTTITDKDLTSMRRIF